MAKNHMILMNVALEWDSFWLCYTVSWRYKQVTDRNSASFPICNKDFQGITYMDEKGRLDRFDKNLWLIGIACMHYLHEMVEAELTNINDPRAVRRPIKGKISVQVIFLKYPEISTLFFSNGRPVIGCNCD